MHYIMHYTMHYNIQYNMHIVSYACSSPLTHYTMHYNMHIESYDNMHIESSACYNEGSATTTTTLQYARGELCMLECLVQHAY